MGASIQFLLFLFFALSSYQVLGQTTSKVTTKTITYINGKMVEEKESVIELDDQQLQKRFQHLYPLGKNPVRSTCPHHHHHHHHHQHGHKKASYYTNKHRHHHHHDYKSSTGHQRDPEAALDKRGDPIEDSILSAIESKEKKAVVYIGIKTKSGMNYSSGAGTFVSKDGHLITNFHVADAFVTSDKYKPEFMLHDGQTISDFQKIECHGTDKDDLCLIKLDVSPDHWFEGKSIQTSIPPQGEKLFMIGHPSGNNWDVRAGESTGVTYNLKSRGTERLEVTVPVRPGFSGGPIFNQLGELVCLASDRLVNSIRGRYDKNSLRHFCVEGHKMRSYLERSGLLN